MGRSPRALPLYPENEHSVLSDLNSGFMNILLTGLIISVASFSSCSRKENPNNIMSNELNTNVSYDGVVTDTATFGTGCFWCTEAIFKELEGVLKVSSGYTGGNVANPTYKEVCEGTTGHAEAIEIVFDPKKITYDKLLEAFWESHDPTSLNKQGNDVGTQYRSAIFYHNEEQRKKAESYKTELNSTKAFEKPIVTEITPAGTFYAAENYHQDYYANNGSQPYCYYVIRPKLEKFKKVFNDRLKKL